MSLTLEEKQIVRSISDIIIHNPESAKILLNTHNIQDIDIFKHMENVIDFVKTSSQVENYKMMLSCEIDKVSDTELRTILKSSLKG